VPRACTIDDRACWRRDCFIKADAADEELRPLARPNAELLAPKRINERAAEVNLMVEEYRCDDSENNVNNSYRITIYDGYSLRTWYERWSIKRYEWHGRSSGILTTHFSFLPPSWKKYVVVCRSSGVQSPKVFWRQALSGLRKKFQPAGMGNDPIRRENRNQNTSLLLLLPLSFTLRLNNIIFPLSL
jgi:hypothetical protein